MINNRLFSGEGFEKVKAGFHCAHPFKHVVFDSFFREDKMRAAVSAFPYISSGWTNYVHHTERKFGFNDLTRFPVPLLEMVRCLHSDEFVGFLSRLTDIPDLVCDPLLSGGGLHVMKNDGFLKVHADFNIHPVNRGRRRALNLILFLNDDWKAEWGGDLQFWSSTPIGCSTSIFPAFNKAVLFEVHRYSFHGVPEPIKCPEGKSRNTMALYYYQKVRPIPIFSIQGTSYLTHDGMPFSEIMITHFENLLLRLYTIFRFVFQWKGLDRALGRFLSKGINGLS